CVERVGIAAGYKYFGTHNWYKEGASLLVGQQLPTGAWGDPLNTCFALLFLYKGRAPILFNKLKFDGVWNAHRRDIANLTHFIEQTKEQPFHWQIVELRAPLDELHDAPILYLTPESVPNFSDAEKQKLRQFTDTGGTILFEASCGNPAVRKWFTTFAKETWPEWNIAKLPMDHEIWTAFNKMKAKPEILGIDDGVRVCVFYSPDDISCAWQTRALAAKTYLFDWGINLYTYATDGAPLRAKLAGRETEMTDRYKDPVKADDIAKDFPDKLISTLAYQYTRKPPKEVRPRPNVCVRLCSIECCFAHPLETDPYNKTFVDDIRGWNRVCNRLYIWDYIIDYSHSVMPFPNLRSLKPNIRFFIAHGVKGLYEEACYFTPASEWAELRTWIIAKTMWRPETDVDWAVDEFLAGYYGPAAWPLRQYIDLIHGQVEEHADWHAVIWAKPDSPWLRPEVLGRAVRLFDGAEQAVAADAVLAPRVAVARLPVLYVQIAQAQPGDARAAGWLDTFEAVARKAGLTTVREHGGTGRLDIWLAAERQRLKIGAK
ncbi:MAG: DUF4838 domain-containing protein, partial [Planctomycetes bacterium]|nr:DUF4838 domain-containing protein [Planctomycetota bacterium]